jgi:hypothetical protein
MHDREEACIQDFCGRPEEKKPLGIPRRTWGGGVLLILTLKKYGGVVWAGAIWLRIGTGGGFL